MNNADLKDWYAGLAMQQMCAGPGGRMVADRDQRYSEEKGNWAEIVADNAYNMAEAMMVERKRRRSRPRRKRGGK